MLLCNMLPLFETILCESESMVVCIFLGAETQCRI